MICNVYGLIIGILFGILMTTIIKEEPRVIVKYPTPDNKKITYVDKTGNCYQYQPNKINCPNDTSLIHKIPVNN